MHKQTLPEAMPAAVVKDGTVTPKFRQGKISPPFLTAKFSPGEIPPPPVAISRCSSWGVKFNSLTIQTSAESLWLLCCVCFFLGGRWQSQEPFPSNALKI